MDRWIVLRRKPGQSSIAAAWFDDFNDARDVYEYCKAHGLDVWLAKEETSHINEEAPAQIGGYYGKDCM